jgi:hypothetical protein
MDTTVKQAVYSDSIIMVGAFKNFALNINFPVFPASEGIKSIGPALQGASSASKVAGSSAGGGLCIMIARSGAGKLRNPLDWNCFDLL